jgi:hypothetical protein
MLKKTLIVTVLASAFASGCGGSGPRTIPVSGTVTYKGKPVANANVSFAPEDPSGLIATGVTDSSGHFKLGTLAAEDGAIVGKYRVTVIARQARRG